MWGFVSADLEYDQIILSFPCMSSLLETFSKNTQTLRAAAVALCLQLTAFEFRPLQGTLRANTPAQGTWWICRIAMFSFRTKWRGNFCNCDCTALDNIKNLRLESVQVHLVDQRQRDWVSLCLACSQDGDKWKISQSGSLQNCKVRSEQRGWWGNLVADRAGAVLGERMGLGMWQPNGRKLRSAQGSASPLRRGSWLTHHRPGREAVVRMTVSCCSVSPWRPENKVKHVYQSWDSPWLHDDMAC